MTNYEAIQFLDNMKHEEAGRAIGNDGFYAELMGHHVKALNMAIKALESKDVLDKIIAEIYRKAHSGQWSDATMYGMLKAVAIIDKHMAESENLESEVKLASTDSTTDSSTTDSDSTTDSTTVEPEKCGDCISRQAVIDRINKLIEVEKKQGTDEWGYGRERVNAYEAMLHMVESEYLHPSVEPERKVGHWIEHEWAQELDGEGYLISNFECDKCHAWAGADYDYCPNCGVKMEVSNG